jgi:hypothetical protein
MCHAVAAPRRVVEPGGRRPERFHVFCVPLFLSGISEGNAQISKKRVLEGKKVVEWWAF